MIDIWKECLEMRFGSGRTNGQQLILKLKNLWLRWLEKGKAFRVAGEASFAARIQSKDTILMGHSFEMTESSWL